MVASFFAMSRSRTFTQVSRRALIPNCADSRRLMLRYLSSNMLVSCADRGFSLGGNNA